MRRYRLTSEEKKIVKAFDNASVPWIFYAGKYYTYFSWLEAVMVEICPMLIKGEFIDERTYQVLINVENVDTSHEVDINELSDYEREYYDNFTALLKIAEKYYKLLHKK